MAKRTKKRSAPRRKPNRAKLLRSGLRLRVPPPKVEPSAKAYRRTRERERDREELGRELEGE
jgi:hypothetical protein